MSIPDYEVCLSIQRALLDAVTPALRRVSFVLSDNLITIYYYYNGHPSETEIELAENSAAEVIADFPESWKIDCKIINVEFPNQIKSQGRIIYSRYESPNTEYGR